MSKKKIIIISAIILVVASVIIFWALGGKNKLAEFWSNNFGQKQETKKELPPLNPTEEEKELVRDKTEEQIKSEFLNRKKLCAENFKDDKIREAITNNSLSKEQAESYFECRAIAEENIQYCDTFEQGSPENKKCRQNFLLAVKFAFPAMKTKKCDSAMLAACQEAGTNDCDTICRIMTSEFGSDCLAVSSLPQRVACEALEKENAEPCDLLSEEIDRQFCKFAYFLAAAAKSDNQEILNNIKIKESYLLARLYFDKESPCKEMALYIGKSQCDPLYNENYLNRLLEIGRDLRGDYRNQSN